MACVVVRSSLFGLAVDYWEIGVISSSISRGSGVWSCEFVIFEGRYLPFACIGCAGFLPFLGIEFESPVSMKCSTIVRARIMLAAVSLLSRSTV